MSNRLDGLGCWVKEEDLVVVLSVVAPDNQVSATNNGQNSLHWHSRSDDEGSTKIDLVWDIEASSLSVFGLVDIVNGPFLTELVCELSNSNVLSLRVLASSDLDDSAILNILEVVLRELELLEPSSVGVPELQVSCLTRILDIK